MLNRAKIQRLTFHPFCTVRTKVHQESHIWAVISALISESCANYTSTYVHSDDSLTHEQELEVIDLSSSYHNVSIATWMYHSVPFYQQRCCNVFHINLWDIFFLASFPFHYQWWGWRHNKYKRAPQNPLLLTTSFKKNDIQVWWVWCTFKDKNNNNQNTPGKILTGNITGKKQQGQRWNICHVASLYPSETNWLRFRE